MRVLVVCLLLTAPLLAGCAGTKTAPLEAPAKAPPQPAPRGNVSVPPPVDPPPVPLPNATAPVAPEHVVRLLTGGSFEVDVPVDVILIGFDAGTGAALQARLEPEPILHAAFSIPRNFPPDPALPNPGDDGDASLLPAQPVARFRVHEAPRALADAAYAAIKATKLPGTAGDVYDANAVEDWLAQELPANGFPLAPETPSLVVLHGRTALPEGHAYRVTYPGGWIQPVRVFGERTPMVVLDASAAPDPYVTPSALITLPATLRSGAARPELRPIDAGGDAAVAALRAATLTAVHYRLLQGSLYPPSIRPCHGVTLILAVQGGTLAGMAPGEPRAETYVDTNSLRAAWEGVVGAGNVHVDLRVLHLPADDPVLDALSRGGGGDATRDAFRYWLDTNWDKYWVAHPGCEPYISFLLFGDASASASGTFGVAMYDVKRSHRISFSSADDLTRFLDRYSGPGSGTVAGRAPGRLAYNWVNELFVHETGHLLGQRHPHDVTFANRSETARQFSSIWTSMSYQQGDRLVGFGAIDRANFLRNRAGFAVQAAVAAGAQQEPAFLAALEALEHHHWGSAYETLRPVLERTP